MKKLVLVCVLLMTPFAIFASVTIDNSWIRATVPQQQSAGAFLQISTTEDTRLISISSPVAKAVEIHEMSMSKDFMKMRSIAYLDLPAGQSTRLESGGTHLMLLGLRQQMKKGNLVPVTLIFQNKNKKKETIKLNIPVEAINYLPADHSKH